MTIKEIANTLGVSKQTVTRTIKKLNIETKWIGNRAVIDSQNDIASITKAIQSRQSNQSTAPTDTNAPENESEVVKKAPDDSKTDSKINPNGTTQQLIAMLQGELDNKEKIIQRQQDTIDNLIRTNTALTARVTMLEDKSDQQQQKAIVVPESKSSEVEETKSKGKIHWWQRLFN